MSGRRGSSMLYPAKVAAMLAVVSIALYLFFSVWPIGYSVFIAFTDANAVNIASDPKLAELRALRESIEESLWSNKDAVLAGAREVERLVNDTVAALEEFRAYLESASPSTFSQAKVNEYRNRVSGNLIQALSIVNSNETYLYYHTELRESLDRAYTGINTMWSEIESVVGFKLFPSQEDLDKVRSLALPRIDLAVEELGRSAAILRGVEEDYASFVSLAVRDIDREIDRLSLHFVGARNFETLFGDSRFPYSLLKTLLFVATSVPLKMAVGVAVAFLFSSPLILGRKAMRAMLLVPWAVPVLLSVTTWRMLFVPGEGPLAGLFSRLVGGEFNIYTHEWDAFALYNIVEAWLAYPFVMTVTMGAIAGVPKELIEASYIDGAGVWMRFRRIMLPLTIRPILFAAILTSGASLQAFMVPLLINNGGPTTTVRVPGFPPALGGANEMMVLYGYNRAWLDQDYGLSAAAYLVVVGILLVYAVAWYYLFYRRGGGAGG